jgi:hypothetical protein
MAFASVAQADSGLVTQRVADSRLTENFFTVERAVEPLPTDEPQLPWLWVHIRRAVVASEKRLPHHQRDEFYILLAPTRVSNGFDTVAGLGVEGYF